MSTPAQLDILINIEAKLNELIKTQQGLRDTTKEAQGLTAALKTGFGIEVARRAVEMFKAGLIDAFRDAMRLADEIDDMSRALGMSTDAYQVLRNTIEETGGEAAALTAAINTQTQSMDAARNVTSSAAGAYRTLGLNLAEIEQMPVEKRIEAIANANARAEDKTAAYRATADLLGSRTLPQLQGALQELAEKGYGRLAEMQQKSGRIMGQAEVEDLARLKDQLEEFARERAVTAAEVLTFYHMPDEHVSPQYRGNRRRESRLAQ